MPPAPSRLILASASAGRPELIARLSLPFEVMPGRIDEPTGFREPRHEVQAVSRLEAAAVARASRRASSSRPTPFACRGGW
jgi:predicted house-cleaning NTP pyrophosphatase (Maf/HAM1 superfamily)